MRTEDLIQSLGASAMPVSRNAVERRVSLGLIGGAFVTFGIVLSYLGLRPDLGDAMFGFPFWMKWGYTISVAAIAILAVVHLARPEARRPKWLALLGVPVAIMVVLAVHDLMVTPAGDWNVLWMGQSWHVCTLRVITLSLPIFFGLILAFRRLAPTHLRLTGAVAGLAAGACGATLYGLHCPEASAVFILVWYSLGILTAAAIGALAGPKLLRW